jgi:hypothetical protein
VLSTDWIMVDVNQTTIMIIAMTTRKKNEKGFRIAILNYYIYTFCSLKKYGLLHFFLDQISSMVVCLNYILGLWERIYVVQNFEHDLIDWFIVFNATFIYIMATRFSGGRNQSTWREPPTMGKQLVNLITCGCESSALFFVIYTAGCEPTPYWW